MQAALVSKSSRVYRAYELIVVQDRQTLVRMARCRAHGGAHLAQTDAAVVVGDTRRDTWLEDSVIVLVVLQRQTMG